MTEPSQVPRRVRSRTARRIAVGLAAALAIALVVFVTDAGGLRSRVTSRQIGLVGSIAVLPFENLSGDPGQEYLSDGITEALVTGLAQTSALVVISRTSVMAYKATTKARSQIARELGVGAVVEGSVLKSGDRVQVTVRLIHSASDQQVWERSFEREFRQILRLQHEIVEAIVERTDARRSLEGPARPASVRSVDPEAHDLYLKGRLRLHRGTEGDLDAAIALFDRAIAKDASDARLWAALAESYLALSTAYRAPAEVMPRAKQAAQRALDLDGRLADAHVALGMVHLQWDWDWAGAARELKGALDLEPGDSATHAAYGLLLVARGQLDEAAGELWLAQQRDPLSLPVNLTAGWVSFQARRFDQAIIDFGQAIVIDPNSGPAHAGLANALAQRGSFALALREAEKAVDADQAPPVLAMVGGVYAADGQANMARRLRTLAVQRVACPLDIAAIHVALNERNEAFGWIERGFTERSACMLFVRTDARLDPLRADRRYADFIERMEFPG